MIVLLFIVANCAEITWSTKKVNKRDSITEQDSLMVMDGVSSDPRYGYSSRHPVKLGVRQLSKAVDYPEKFFKSLTGPNGEMLTFRRLKSCCFFKTVNNTDAEFDHVGVLEVYHVEIPSLNFSQLVYINFFDEGQILAPRGLAPKKLKSY